MNKAGKGSASGTEPEGIAYGYGSGYKVSRVQNFLENDRFISIDIAYETSRRVKITSPSAQVTTDEERIETYYSLDGKGSIIGNYSQTQTGEVYVSGETQNGVAGFRRFARHELFCGQFSGRRNGLQGSQCGKREAWKMNTVQIHF